MPTRRGPERPRTVEEALQGAEPTCRWLASRYFAPGLDFDDLLQEARFGVFKAWRDHQPPHPWAGFVSLCAQRQVITAVKAAQRGKHRPLNEAVSLDAPLSAASAEEPSSLHELLPAGAPEPHVVLESRWQLRTLSRAAVERLSSLEWVALSLLLDGRPYTEIKALDNAAQRARRKLRAAA